MSSKNARIAAGTTVLACILALALAPASSATRSGRDKDARLAPVVRIGNYYGEAPYGIAIIVDDEAGFLIDPDRDDKGSPTKYYAADPATVPPGTTAPDFSYVQVSFRHRGANVRMTWGRSGPGAVVARLETDRAVVLALRLPRTWPRFHAIYTAASDGLTGYGIAPRGAFIPFALRCSPPPALVRANVTSEAEVVLDLDPARPARFVAGVGTLPDPVSADPVLEAAGRRYEAARIAASGAWGDFAGAIADNMNFSKLYGSDNGRVVHSDGRGWWLQSIGASPDLFPYFVWDSFFNALLASFEDADGGKATVRAVLSFQTPEGFVPSFSHWNAENGTYVTLHRSMPPVGALCVWKMHQRRPDGAFLAEVYSGLVRWHDWWPGARDGNRNGLLEWGSGQGWWQGAQFETGWDDNVHYAGTEMAGDAMNADAVDLNALWSMDAEYLALIADALGRSADAARFRAEQKAMNARINERLWNDALGIYCSRLWEARGEEGPVLLTHVAFKGGFEAVFYRDWLFREEAGRRHDLSLDFDWGAAAPLPGMGGDRWAARWTGALVPPEAGRYRFTVEADEGARLHVNGALVLDSWTRGGPERRTADIDIEAGRPCPVVLELFEESGPASLHFSVRPLLPGRPGTDWLTRLTPMNFYPLICGAPDAERARRVLSWMYREDKFWGPWLFPSVPYDDPVWHQQTYWHGHVWPPANYLLWQGIRRYADAPHRAEFVRRNVDLFMRNWRDDRLCCENYRSSDGRCGDDPHYTWGALLALVGLDALSEIGPGFGPVSGAETGIGEAVTLRRVPVGGRLYRIENKDGRVEATPEAPAR